MLFYVYVDQNVKTLFYVFISQPVNETETDRTLSCSWMFCLPIFVIIFVYTAGTCVCVTVISEEV